jgi:PTS system nitrogen regulatory IIA component
MKLSEILEKDAIVTDLAARHKKEVLEELCQAMSRVEELQVQPLLEVLLERERLGSTGIGDGIAIPHGKSPEVKQLLVACGRSKQGVDFESMDGRLTHLFFLLVAPENSTGTHLKALAKISRLLKDEHFRQELMSAESQTEMHDLITARDSEF